MDRAFIKGEIALRVLLETLFLVVLGGSCLLLTTPAPGLQLVAAALATGSGLYVHHHHEQTRRLLARLRAL
jgi:hypothetical protein